MATLRGVSSCLCLSGPHPKGLHHPLLTSDSTSAVVAYHFVYIIRSAALRNPPGVSVETVGPTRRTSAVILCFAYLLPARPWCWEAYVCDVFEVLLLESRGNIYRKRQLALNEHRSFHFEVSWWVSSGLFRGRRCVLQHSLDEIPRLGPRVTNLSFFFFPVCHNKRVCVRVVASKMPQALLRANFTRWVRARA